MEARGRAKKKCVYYDLTSFRNISMSEKKLEIIKILQQDEVNLVAIEDGDTVLDVTFENIKFSKKEVIDILEICFDYHVKGNDERAKVLHVKIADRMRDIVDLLMKHKAKINEISSLTTHYFIEDEYNKFWKQQFKLNDAQFEKSDKELLERTSPSFVNWLLSNGFDFDYKNNNGQSALQSAIACKLLYILPSLLKQTNDIDYKDGNSMTLLHLFFGRNDTNKREFRVEPDKEWYSKYTKRYASNIVKTLLDRGVPVDAIDIHGQTALQLAIEGKEEIYLVKLLLERLNINQQNNSGETLFFEMINMFTSRNDPEANYYMDILRLLRSKGAEVNCQDANGVRPIQKAVERKSLRAVEFLRDSDADFNVTTKAGKNLLHLLADKSNEYALKEKSYEKLFIILVSNGVCEFETADESGDLPLHIAAKTANYPIVQKLINLGVDVNCRNTINKKTPLHYAAENRQAVEVVKLLLDNGANVNSKDDDLGRRPLCSAVRISYNDEIIMILLARGAYVNARDANGKTPLYTALRSAGMLSCTTVTFLLKYGADINESGNYYFKSNEYRTRSLLVEHWIRLMTAKLPCSKDYEGYVADYQQFYEDCLIEVEKLKSTYIDNRTSLCRWLLMDPNSRCFRVNNEKLTKLAGSPTLEKQFPKYAILIVAYYREAATRKAILQSAVRAWYELTNVDLPDICVNFILAYLSNADLLDMIEDD